MTYPQYQPQLPGPMVPLPPPKRGLSTGAIVAIVIGAVVVLMCGICMVGAIINGAVNPLNRSQTSSDPIVTTTRGATTTAAGHVIRFEVSSPSGAATASLINWSTLEDSALDRDQALPWSKEVQLETRSGLVGVNASVTGGRVACKLFVDGVLVDEGESDGTVNCSDLVSR